LIRRLNAHTLIIPVAPTVAATCRSYHMKHTIAILGLLVLIVPASTEAQSFIYQHTAPDETRVGSCYGNCGAGCSGTPNPCGGNQGWEHSIDVQPYYAGSQVYDVFCSPDVGGWVVVYDVYTYQGRWTYHGRKADGCAFHDTLCRNTLIPIPFASFLECLVDTTVVAPWAWCDNVTDYDWPYSYWGTALLYSHWEDYSC
jgi:hypothetical protein